MVGSVEMVSRLDDSETLFNDYGRQEVECEDEGCDKEEVDEHGRGDIEGVDVGHEGGGEQIEMVRSSREVTLQTS